MSQSTVKLVNFNDSDDGMVFVLQAASTEQLANEITDYLRSREYRLESGTALNGIWGTGNAFLRALFGGLVKRYKFQLATEGPPSSATLKLSKVCKFSFISMDCRVIWREDALRASARA